MYNEETKRIFLAENPSKEWVFEALSAYERTAGKDVAEMDKEESLSVLESYGLSNPSSISSVLSLIKTYVKWRKQKGLAVNTDGILSIKTSDVDFARTYGSVLFKDEKDLIDSIGLVRSFDDGYIEPPVLVLGWLGLQREEIADLRDWDVNLSDRAIYGRDGSALTTGFSDCICDVLEQYRKCKVSERINGLTPTEVIKDLSVDSFLKRMLPRGSKRFGTEFSKLQIDTALSKLAVRYEELGHPRRHTFTNVWRSGRFHALWELEQTGVDITAKEQRPLVETTMRGKKNYYNTIKMYEAYKKAFYE